MLYLSAIASAATLQLGEGLRLALDPDLDRPTVSVATIVEAGRADEPPGLEGSAHTAEHLWFEAQLRPEPSPTVWRLLRSAGCDAQGFTYDTHTIYITRCPADRADLLVEIEIGRLRDPLAGIDEGDLARAVAVIDHEAEEYGEFSDQILPRIYEALYPSDHPIVARHARAKSTELALDPLRSWLSEHQRQANVTIAFAGAFDANAVRAAFESAFGPGKAAVSPVPRRQEPPQRRTMRLAPREISLPVQRGGIAIGWVTPPDRMTSFEAGVIAEIISRSLWERWRFDPRVLGVDCTPLNESLSRPFICWLDAADDAPLGELAAEARSTIDAMWVGASKRLIRSRFEAGRVSADLAVLGWSDGWGGVDSPWVAILAQHVHYTGIEPSDDQISLHRSASGLFTLAQEHFAPTAAAILVVKPSEREKIGAPPEAPPRAEAAPQRELPSPARPVDAAERTLPNGLRIVAIHRPDARLVYGAFLSREHAARYAELVEMSTLRSSAVERIHNASVISSGIGWLALAGADPSTVARALHAHTRPPELSSRLFLTSIIKGGARWRQSARDASFWSLELPLVASDPRHLPDALGQVWRQPVSFDEIAALTQARGSPDRLEIVVVGASPPEEMLDAVEKEFASDIRVELPVLSAPVQEDLWNGRRIAIIDDPGSEHANIVAACSRKDQNKDLIDIAAISLQERLWTELREEQSLVYTPAAWREGSTLVVQIRTRAEEAALALSTVERELSALQQDAAIGWARGQAALRGPSLADPVALLWFARDGERLRTADRVESWDRSLLEVGGDVASALSGCQEGLSIGIAGPKDLLVEQLGALDPSPEIDTWSVSDLREALEALSR